MTEPKIPNIDTLSCLIDRLCIEVHKAAYFENAKRTEHAKENPDLAQLAKWDRLSRDAVELRSAIKNRIDALFQEAVSSGDYRFMREPRTFAETLKANARVATDIIDARYKVIGDMAATGDLIPALEALLEGEEKR